MEDNQINQTPTQNTAPEPSAPQTQPSPKKKRNTWAIVLAVLLVLSLAGNAYLYMELQSEKDSNEQLAAELVEAQGALQEANTRVEALLEETKAVRDQQRESDLDFFVGTVRSYKTENGTYPSTEPTEAAAFWENNVISQNPEFNDPLTDEQYDFVPVATVQDPPELEIGSIQYQWPGMCAEDGSFEDTEDEEKSASRLLLESGSVLCVDS